MSDAFERELLKVLPREGRDSDDPDDAGGLTSRGITEATARAAFEQELVSTPDPRKLDAREIRVIYKAFYWDRIHGNLLPAEIAGLVFDEAVNCGVGTAVMNLQNALNVVLKEPIAADGKFGPKTKAAIADVLRLESNVVDLFPEISPLFFREALIRALLEGRAAYYVSITDEETPREVKNRKFFRGWMNRLKAWMSRFDVRDRL